MLQAPSRQPAATVEETTPEGRAAAGERPSRARVSVADLAERYGLVLVWAAIVVVFSLLRPETFFTVATLQTVLGSQAVLLVLTLGLLFSLRVGEFDLSVAGTMSLALVLVGYLNVLQGWPIGLAVAAALLAGVAVGAINAFMVLVVGVESIIATLGMGTLLLGIGFGINSEITDGVSASLTDAVTTRLLGLPLVFFYATLLTALAWYVFSCTPLGRYLFVVGANRSVARLSGLRVEAIRALALIVTSFVSALAGVLLAGQLGSSSPNTAQAYLLPAFAGAFLGSTVIKPGRFNPVGSFIAVYFLVTGITGLNLLGQTGWVEQVFYGASLMVAVAFSTVLGRKRATEVK